MNALKSILVHVDSSPQLARRLQVAAGLARAHGADLRALYSVLPVYMQYPYSLTLSAEAATLLQAADRDRLDSARSAFDHALATGDVAAGWAADTGEPIQAFSRAALYSDLVVFGQRDPDNQQQADVPGDFAESVIISSGKPGLIIPRIHDGQAIGRVALVAWKPAREAARAVAASLPLLRAARKVHVAVWTEGDGGGDGADGPDGTSEIATYLDRHGVKAEVNRCGPATREVGEYLLSMASDVGADLLVMGCYGHGRIREWALGGATRSVLRSMTVPVLMAH